MTELVQEKSSPTAKTGKTPSPRGKHHRPARVKKKALSEAQIRQLKRVYPTFAALGRAAGLGSDAAKNGLSGRKVQLFTYMQLSRLSQRCFDDRIEGRATRGLLALEEKSGFKKRKDMVEFLNSVLSPERATNGGIVGSIKNRSYARFKPERAEHVLEAIAMIDPAIYAEVMVGYQPPKKSKKGKGKTPTLPVPVPLPIPKVAAPPTTPSETHSSSPTVAVGYNVPPKPQSFAMGYNVSAGCPPEPEQEPDTSIAVTVEEAVDAIKEVLKALTSKQKVELSEATFETMILIRRGVIPK